MSIGTFNRDALAARIGAQREAKASKEALEAFAKVTGDDAFVEADGGTPLFDGAMAGLKKAVIAGMVALSAFSAVAPAMAQTFNPAVQTQAAAFLKDADRAAATVDGKGFVNGHINKISGISVEQGEASLKSNFDVYVPGAGKLPLPIYGRTCDAYVAPRLSLEAINWHLKINGADVTPVYMAKATAKCLVQKMMDQGELDSHEKVFHGTSMLVDMTATVASAKYDKAFLDAMLEYNASDALTRIINARGGVREDGLIFAEALGRLKDFMDTNPNAWERFSKADVSEFPTFANAFIRHAHDAVAKSGLNRDKLYHAKQSDVPGILAAAGLHGAAKAAKAAADAGLVKDGLYLIDTTSIDKCSQIERTSSRSQRRAQGMCRLVETLSGADIEEVYQTAKAFDRDAATFLDAHLPQAAPQVSAMKR